MPSSGLETSQVSTDEPWFIIMWEYRKMRGATTQTLGPKFSKGFTGNCILKFRLFFAELVNALLNK